MPSEALLLMDFQQGVVDRYAGDRTALLGAVTSAARAARAAEIPVVYVRVGFRDGYPEIDRRNRLFSALSNRGGFGEQDAATQVHDELEVEPGDTVVTKRRVSAFAGSDLEMILRAMHVETLVLGGIATSGDALPTLCQAADLDFDLVVLRDACADGDLEVHRLLLDKVFTRQATVLTVKEWAATTRRPPPG